MKNLRIRVLSGRQLLGVSIALLVLASAIVGYTSQPQRSPLVNLPSHGIITGPTISVDQKQGALLSGADTLPMTYSTSFGGRAIEMQGYLTIRVDDARSTIEEAVRLAASLGGYVASSSYDETKSIGSVIIRVPESNFSLAMRSLSALGTVKAQSISSNDVTEQYVNLQAQLDSYRTEQATLLRILNSSKNVKDALDTEATIQNVQSQINRLEGQIRVMQRLVDFATINIQLAEPANPTLDIAASILTALQALFTVTRGMLILGAALIPVATIAGIVYLPYKHFSRKKLQIEAK